MNTPQLFLTDYASYNNGTQFEFGHWVDLTEFSTADDFMNYITEHFKECDVKNPLFGGTPREEIMFTDFEGFPKQLYSESMSTKEIEQLFEFLELSDGDKIKVAFIVEQGEKFEYALSKYEDVILNSDNDNAKFELFKMYYPDAEKATEGNDYLTIDYDRFIKENFTEFEHDGEYYLIEDSWNH